MIIAANSNTYHGFSIEEAVVGIREAGFRYIELTATKGWTEHVFPTDSFQRLLSVRDLLKENGLTPIAMSGHCNLMDTMRISDFENNIALAAFFGCKYIVSSIGEAHLKDNASVGNDVVAEHISKLIPMLEKYKLMLVLEVHGCEHGSGAIINEIVKLINSPLVKINYDTANALFYSDVDLIEDIKGCVGNIAYMHLKDKAGERKSWNFPAIGQGDIDFKSVFEVLDDAKNDCPLSVEIEFTQNGPSDLNEVNQALKMSAEYLRKRGYTL